MSVTVLEWRSRRQMNQLKRWLTAPGHASMVLMYPDRSGKTRGFAHTITWFPEGVNQYSGEENNGSSGKLFGSTGKWVPQNAFEDMGRMGGTTTVKEWLQSFDQPGWMHQYKKHLKDNEELGEWGNAAIRPPEEQVTILSRSDPDAFAGLYDSNIRTWWLAFVNDHSTYQFLTRSCSAVVGMALVAGGGEQYASKPPGIWTPDSVMGWAKSIKKAVDKENQEISGAFNTLKQEAAKFPNPGPVWTREQWYKASEANVYFFSRRYGLLQTVDTLLDMYHSIDARSNVTKQFKEQAKDNCLSLVVQNLAQILRERSTSKRKDAIGQLASQIREKYRLIREEEERIAEELRIRRELELDEIRIHNEPYEKRLREIKEEQNKLMLRILRIKQGDLQTMQSMSTQLNELKLEKEKLQKKLR